MFARLANWKEILDTAHLSADRQMDPVSKWLIITRATVFSMTLTSGLIGAMLAIQSAPAAVNYGYLALALLGIVIAHAANNIINDYLDLEVGIDTNDYVRAQYMPHPILSGMVTKAQLRTAILLLNAVVNTAFQGRLAEARSQLLQGESAMRAVGNEVTRGLRHLVAAWLSTIEGKIAEAHQLYVDYGFTDGGRAYGIRIE